MEAEAGQNVGSLDCSRAASAEPQAQATLLRQGHTKEGKVCLGGDDQDLWDGQEMASLPPCAETWVPA